jgi:folate-binding protein YgfZ
MFSSPNHREEWQESHDNVAVASDETWSTARIECGLPQWEAELTPQILAAETDPRREFYSVTKGCYPGQEILARIDSRGHTNRQLFVLTAEPGATILPGAEVYLSGNSVRPIGALCSWSACSPACNGSSIGLAFLRTAEVSQDCTLYTSAGIPLTLTDQPRRRRINY